MDAHTKTVALPAPRQNQDHGREIERMEGGSPTKGNNLITMVLVFYFAKKVFGVEGCRDRVINLRDSAFISGGRAVCTGPSSHHQGEIAATKR